MGFGRNPYVPKAQVAEQKAADASDDAARRRAHREAAHEWDRAAERERPGKQRAEYEHNAERNRAIADEAAAAGDDGSSENARPADSAGGIALTDRRLLN